MLNVVLLYFLDCKVKGVRERVRSFHGETKTFPALLGKKRLQEGIIFHRQRC